MLCLFSSGVFERSKKARLTPTSLSFRPCLLQIFRRASRFCSNGSSPRYPYSRVYSLTKLLYTVTLNLAKAYSQHHSDQKGETVFILRNIKPLCLVHINIKD